MIKLTLNPSSHPIPHLYEKNVVLIGSCGSADLLLPDDTSQEDHIKIQQQDGRYLAINQANDPFVTINGMPFGKKVLANGDLVQIGNTFILFEEYNEAFTAASSAKNEPAEAPALTSAKEGPLLDTENSLPSILDKKIIPPQTREIEKAINPDTANPYQDELDALEQEAKTAKEYDLDPSLDQEAKDLDIEALMRQVEELEDHSVSLKETNWQDTQCELSQMQKEDAAPINPDEDFDTEQLGFPLHTEQKTEQANKEMGNAQQEEPVGSPFEKIEYFAETVPENQAPAAETIRREPEEKPEEKIDVPASLPDNEMLDPTGTRSENVKTAEPSAAPIHKPRSLKDYDLTETEDDIEGAPSQKEEVQQNEKKSWKNWKFITLIIGIILLLFALAGGIIYLNMTDQSEEEEARAIDGVSDVTMALTYAQVKHIKPQNQDWSDPEFLKNNLLAVLGAGYTPSFSLDSHGQFLGSSYILRIYTSTDQTHFLVIAQPAPSLLQWLIPKSAVIVDSATMEIRRVHDLKALNRLLVNPGTLDGTNAVEVSNIVKQGDLIPLSYLASKSTHNGFTPPKALALVRSGAQDKIYNAPRYYRFGETFMKQAMSLSESASGSHEVELLQEEIDSLSKYPNMVFYTSQGIQWALQAQKALSIFVPQGKFLVGYLKYNIRGVLTGSHLLMDEGLADIAFEPKAQNANEQHGITRNSKEIDGLEGEPSSSLLNEHDRKHPLFLQLNALKHSRQQILRPLQEEITRLFSKHAQTYVGDFHTKIHELLANYENASQAFDQKMAKRITELTQEYSSIPLDQVMTYIDAAGLSAFMKEKMKEVKNISEDSHSQETQDRLLLKLLDSKDLEELDRNIADLQNDLTLEKHPEMDQLIRYQNQARGLVLKKVEEFLFSPQGRLSKEAFKEENKPLLTKILQSAWISDNTELEYYLNEFEAQIHR